MENRLKAVKRYLELSFDKESELDDLVFLASQICATPIASITLVDDKKQYPVIGVGDLISSSCDIAFCNQTVSQGNILEIPDAKEDPGFKNNPLVIGEPYIRFYAGVPLITSDGHTIGSLCVIDHQPKKLSEKQLKSLGILSKQVMHRLELRLKLETLKESIVDAEHSKELLEQAEVIKTGFFDHCNDYFILINPHLEIVSFNKPAEDFFLKSEGRLSLEVGTSIFNFTLQRNIPAIKDFFETVKGGVSKTVEILANPQSGDPFWNKFTVSPLYNSKNELIGITCIGCNVDNEKRQQEKISQQKSTLSQIAQLHSHQIRHPLTNILGIINIIKQDGFVMSEQFLGYLDSASKELDMVIRNIVIESSEAA
jgi:hypothetical protein